MGLLDELSDVIEQTRSDVREKAEELRTLAQLKKEYKETKRYINKRYIELGEAYYNKNKSKKDLTDITDALKKLDSLQEEIDSVSGNDVKCEVCGAKNLKEAVYCSKCGSKIDYNADVADEPMSADSDKAAEEKEA